MATMDLDLIKQEIPLENRRIVRANNRQELTHFENDEAKAMALELKRQKNKAYSEKKKLVLEEDKENRRVVAEQSMNYLLNKSRMFSMYFNEKLKKHTIEKKIPLGNHNVVDEVDKENEGSKFDIMSQLKYFKGVLRPYQVEGVTWMSILYENKVNGILADEMGLGKTIQVIALLCHLYEKGIDGPHLIIAPLSTLANWMSEFKKFAPKIPVKLFYGSAVERPHLKKTVKQAMPFDDQYVNPVIITNYRTALVEHSYLRSTKWQYVIIDEGHCIKNPKSLLAKELGTFRASFKLLLTGTPIQNNMSELCSLLYFLLPHIFKNASVLDSLLSVDDIEEQTDELLKTDMGSKIHSVLAPFMLRRLKSEVLNDLVPKKEVLVYCPLSQLQKDIYIAVIKYNLKHLKNMNSTDTQEEIVDRNTKRACRRVNNYFPKDESFYAPKSKKTDGQKGMVEKEVEIKQEPKFDIQYFSHITMQNRVSMYRKVVNHPYLIHYPLDVNGSKRSLLIDENIVKLSGKMLVLDALLAKLKSRKHKVLLFSTFVMMLDLIVDYLEMRGYTYCYLHGSCDLENRQESIDAFNNDPNIFIFLISTRAGGLGLNLTGADTVIFYDRDWNPQVDIQAQDRCHRIGQTKPVMIYSLVTKNTYDERILKVGNSKRKLEKIVIQPGIFNKIGSGRCNTELEELKNLQSLLENDENCEKIHPNGLLFSDTELDKLLDRSELYEQMNSLKQSI